jgi:Holliday junction resolvase RusA-like endonuclease
MIITFTALGHPTGKGRPRLRVQSFGGKACARAYTDSKTQKAENSFLAQALPHKPAAPLTGPLAVEIVAYYAIPASYSKRKTADALANAIYPMSRRDDADNVAKLCLDALNGVFWDDDTQVVDLQIAKRYDTVPRIEMRIATMVPLSCLPSA